MLSSNGISNGNNLEWTCDMVILNDSLLSICKGKLRFCFFVATETGETLKKKNHKNIYKQKKLCLIEVDRCC